MALDKNKEATIVIYGAGLIGCTIGGCIQHGISSCNPPPTHLPSYKVIYFGRPHTQQQLKHTGLTIELHSTNKCRPINIAAKDILFFSEIDEAFISHLKSCSAIFLCVKSHDTEHAAKEFLSYIPANCSIISMQNGVDNTRKLSQLLPTHEIINAIVPFNIIQAREAHYKQTTDGIVLLEDSSSSTQFASILEKGGLACKIESEISALQWTKLIMNLNNSVNALAGIPLLEQLKQREYRNVLASLIEEALNVLKANQIKTKSIGTIKPSLLPFLLRLPNPIFLVLAKKMLNISPDATSSMQEDLRRQRTTEIDYLNGAIVRLAMSSQTTAPKNAKIQALVHKAQAQQSGSPKLSATELTQALSKTNHA